MKEIFQQVLHGKVHIHVGKLGISDALIAQIKLQFKTKKMLKIKFLTLHEYDNMKEASEDLAKLVNARVMDVRGKTCILQDVSKSEKK